MFRAELHIHTVLSPCAEIEMIPPLIVQAALNKSIDIIAITDHNASENFNAVQAAAENSNLVVLPGMELQTQEEVHVLCIFDTIEQLSQLQSIVNKNINLVKNRPEYFGEQFIVDQTGDYIRSEEKMLLISTNISIEYASKIVRDLGGLFIPAHIDRNQYGILLNLGFIPNNLHFDALELSQRINLANPPYELFSYIEEYPCIKNGDAHQLDQILGLNKFYIEEPSIKEMILALSGKNQRYFQVSDSL